MISDEQIKNRLNLLLQTTDERNNKLKHLVEKNRQNLLSLNGQHRGKRCFIIGSSPSLKQLDLTKLNNEYTFTVNRGYMLRGQGLDHSTYHVISDLNFLKDFGEIEKSMISFSKKFLIYAGVDFPDTIEDKVFFDKNPFLSKIPDDISKPLVAGFTVIVYALQLAYFMGFSEINIIGVDLDFAINKGHAYDETSGEKKRQAEESIKNANRMLNNIRQITSQLEEANIVVQNASPSGIVNFVPRIVYEKLFEDNKCQKFQ